MEVEVPYLSRTELEELIKDYEDLYDARKKESQECPKDRCGADDYHKYFVISSDLRFLLECEDLQVAMKDGCIIIKHASGRRYIYGPHARKWRVFNKWTWYRVRDIETLVSKYIMEKPNKGNSVPNHEAAFALASAWAEVDGNTEAFKAGIGKPIDEQPGGRYAGYLADADALIAALKKRGFVISAATDGIRPATDDRSS